MIKILISKETIYWMVKGANQEGYLDDEIYEKLKPITENKNVYCFELKAIEKKDIKKVK